jgi:Uncharacterized protein conserved in bacteria (DUF2188)
MARGWVHTVRRNGVWLTEIEGEGALFRHESQAAAVEAGTEAARRLRTRHLIHGMDGGVVDNVSYEADGRKKA